MPPNQLEELRQRCAAAEDAVARLSGEAAALHLHQRPSPPPPLQQPSPPQEPSPRRAANGGPMSAGRSPPWAPSNGASLGSSAVPLGGAPPPDGYNNDAFWAPKSPAHNPAYSMVDPTSSYGAPAYGGSGGAAASAPRPRPLGAPPSANGHGMPYPSSLVDAAAAPTWDGRADALCRLVLDTALDARVSPAHAALAHASPPPAWGGGSPQPLSSPLACGQVVHALAVVADGGAGGAATLLTAGRDKIIRGYSLRGRCGRHTLHSDRIWDLLPLGGGAFASASADRNVRIWQLRRGDHDYARGATPPPRRARRPPAGRCRRRS